jgi:hypothetical protein
MLLFMLTAAHRVKHSSHFDMQPPPSKSQCSWLLNHVPTRLAALLAAVALHVVLVSTMSYALVCAITRDIHGTLLLPSS